MKTCNTCNNKKSDTEFCKDKRLKSGLQAICKQCYRERAKPQAKIFRQITKLRVFEHYGLKCSCCGEDTYEFLTIDHINNDGKQHRREIQSTIYLWLIRNNFPKEFQTLCFNCNCGKSINKGVCPHRRK
jgi:hypothetical protein